MTTFEWSEWRNGNVLWIQSVYVAKEFRGRKIYKAMYEYIQNRVTGNPQLRGIRLYADTTNADALAAMLSRLSVFAHQAGPALGSVDLNPVMAMPDGAFAVDAVIDVVPAGEDR